MVSAVVSAVLGYLLSLSGEYGGDLLSIHQWLGISLAVGISLVYLLHRRGAKPRSVGYYMLALLILTGFTGHYGGMLTHGEGYLLNALPDDIKAILGVKHQAEPLYAFEDIHEAELYGDLVVPIMTSKCMSCHNPNKLKGSLRLDTPEGILEGGENGPIVDRQNLAQSELLKLIHLPIEDDRHMPPRGKKPLSRDELAVLSWWVETGAEFSGKVSEFTADAEVSTALDNIQSLATQVTNPVLAKKINEAKAKHLKKARESGVLLSTLTSETHLLEARIPEMAQGLNKMLSGLTDQIVWLDLARSNCQSQYLKDLPAYKNIIKLELQQTQIDDQALSYVAELPYLESLNLYGTRVTDQGISELASHPYLKRIFLWDTEVTEQGLLALRNSNPDIIIDSGLAFHQLDSIKLAPPTIESSKIIFKDRGTVTLSSSVEQAKIYYTLDGSTPNPESMLYQSPINLDQSTELKAIAVKEGWTPSEVANQTFLKVKYLINDIEVRHQPSDQYFGEGVISLADGIKGSQDFRDGNWLGFNKEDLVADLDLGEIAEPKQVMVSCLEDMGAYIFYPTDVMVEGSVDGFNYKRIGQLSRGRPQGNTPPGLKSFTVDLASAQYRYLRITAENVGICPPWHPGSGDNAWLFVDEIVIN